LLIDLTGEGTGLTTAKMLATLELMIYMRIVIFTLGFGLSHYFELKIIFERTCTILNLYKKKMTLID
jgi:hypothetical protein